MQNLMENKTLKNSGITLMALVITIIVLLILAGISITMLAGDNSILQKAGEAKEKTEEAQATEQARIDEYADVIDETMGVVAKLSDKKTKEVLYRQLYAFKEAEIACAL